MGIEEIARLLAGSTGDAGAFGLELPELLLGAGDGIGKARLLRLHLIGAKRVFGYRQLARLDAVREPDGDARRHPDPVEDPLARPPVSFHRTCSRPDEPELRPPLPHRRPRP